MKLISLEGTQATIEFRGKVRTLEARIMEEGWIRVPFGGKVGRTGNKIWKGELAFRFDSTRQKWIANNMSGGLNTKAFTPVCFVEDIPEGMLAKR
jgi:hypothetical protein